MAGSKIGVVLSSGGGRGIFGHTGFMLALEELGVSIGASSGCSAGAVVGGMLASGVPARRWADVVTKVRTKQYWTPRSSWQLLYQFGVHQGRGLKGLSSTDAAVRFLAEHLLVDSFEACRYPFSAAAINLGTGRKTLFHKGPLALGIMASAAMAGFYDPVEIDGQYCADGAIIDLAPADAICCHYGLDVLLVHHLAQRDYRRSELQKLFTQPWTIVHVLHLLIYRQRPWYATGQARSIHTCPCGCKAIVVVVEPDLPELIWPLTEGGVNLVEAAHSHAVEQLQPILESIMTDPRSLLGH